MDSVYGPPYSAIDVVILPGLCFAFTLLFRFLAWSKEKNNKSGKGMKRLAWVSLAFGLFVALEYAWRMFDPATGHMYQKMMESMVKVKLAHWIAIVTPFLLVIAMILWDRTEKRLGRPIAI